MKTTTAARLAKAAFTISVVNLVLAVWWTAHSLSRPKQEHSISWWTNNTIILEPPPVAEPEVNTHNKHAL